MFEIRFEEATGIIVVTVLGAWTRREVHRYRGEIRDAVIDARNRGGAVRILVDSRRGTVVPPELIAPLSRTRDGLMQDDDRIAGLVESSVRKLEVRNTVGNPKWQFFLSEAAARTWLTAMDHGIAKAS